MSLGALLVLAIPYVDDRVLQFVVDWDPGARLNPLVAAAILFGPMSVVLAAVTPIAVRIAALDVATLGRTAGRLFAVSTVGSIVGTFATAFVLIPELGTNQLLALGAAVLLAGTALVAVARSLPIVGVAALAAAAAAAALSSSLAPEQGGTLTAAAAENYSPVYRLQEGSVAGNTDYAAEGFRVRYRKDSAYHSIAVVEDEQDRYLRFDSSFQSAMDLDDPFVTPFDYVPYLSLAFAYRPEAANALYVGLGGGSAPKRAWRDFPDLQLQAVELDPEVVDVARKWFALPQDPRLAVEVEDGRRYLQRNDRRWDVIVLDAYYSDALPFHLTTQEFLELVRDRLAPGGIVVANMIGALEGENSKLFRAFYRTYRSVFPSVAVHPVALQGDPRRSGTSSSSPARARCRAATSSRSAGPRSRPSTRRSRTCQRRDRRPLREARSRRGDVPVLTTTTRRPTRSSSSINRRTLSRRRTTRAARSSVSAVASSSETSTMSSPWSAAIRPNLPSLTRSAAFSP